MFVPGTLMLWAAFLLGLASTVTYALAVKDEEKWLGPARQAFVLMTIGVVAASALLMYLIVTHDYRLSYVFAYSDNLLPTHYLISTFWAGQEGSFLLWVLCAALLGLPLIRFARDYESRAMIFYNLTMLSLLMLLLKQNPFAFHQGLTAAAVPMDGNGLNPLLQNPWMVIHPPVMFVGYASLAIPFAFAMAALWMRRYDEWTRVSLPWVLNSVLTLGTAIMLGGYWAYETLGWGGYWGWDPVENASLVPWLATVALAHGMLLQRGRQRFRRLNLVLAIFAFLLVIYATFLTRSGVLADFSVHSFVDLGITGWLVFIMLFFLVVGIGLLAWRWREIPTEVGEEPFISRTIFFVLGILMLILIGLVVVVGTSAPLITRITLFWDNPSQVGPDFYNKMGFYLAVFFSIILGVVPFLGWSRAKEGAARRLGIVLAIVAALMVLAFWLGVRTPMAAVYIAAALFTVVANSWALAGKLRNNRWRAAGGAISHIGMGLMILAFLTTGWLDRETKLRLHQDQPQEALGYTMTFRGVEKPTPASRDAMVVEVTDPRGRNFVLKPKMWINQKTDQLVANPDIKSFMTRDLYVAPVEYKPGEEEAVSGRLVLSKDEPVAFRDWQLTFKGFDMESQHAVAGAFTVGVVVELQRPDAETVTLEPSVISSQDGVNAVSVEIPGTPGARLRANGMSVDSGQVRIELLGLGGGIGRTTVLHKGETLGYKDLEITFQDFDMSDFDAEAGKINFGAVFSVSDGERSSEVVPFLHGGGENQTTTPALVPGTGGISLNIGSVDAEGGAVQLMVFDPYLEAQASKPASLVLDISTKPLIVLVWIGTILVMIGTTMAILIRRRDVAAIPVR